MLVMSNLIVFLIFTTIITPIKSTQFEPIPHAEVLDGILSNKVFNGSDSNDPVFEYLFGNTSTASKTNKNLDINKLDSDNVRKIIDIARNKAILRGKDDNAAYELNPYLINQTFNLMKQSIYGTRYRLQNTRKYRLRYRDSEVYHIALLYGSFLQILLKMDNLLANMEHFPVHTHFIWYLIIYEKLLAKHTDAHNIMERIFLLHYEVKKDSVVQNDANY